MDFLWLPTEIAAVHALLVGVVAMRVVMVCPHSGSALAWILLVALMPLVGIVLYVAFGERRIGHLRRDRSLALQQPRTDYQRQLRESPAAQVNWRELADAAAVLDRIGSANVGFPTLAGNDLELLTSADAVLAAIEQAIAGARTSLDLQFYIWHPGGRADAIAAAVVDAAKRGVACRVLVDALGSACWLRSPWPARLREAGVKVIALLPVGLLGMLRRRGDLRNHRKIVIVDNEVAFTGSMNLVDPRFFKQDSGVGQWIDAMVRVRGPAVAALFGVLTGDWLIETGAAAATVTDAPGLQPGARAGDAAVQVVSSGPVQGGDRVGQMVLMLLFAARRRVVVTTPYFIPDDSILRALRSAAVRGVEVTLVVPEQVDSWLVRHASRSYFAELLAAGARIQLYRGGLLHTKSIAVDDDLVMFGTHNLDLRSLCLNFEVSLFTYDKDFAARVRTLQESYLAACVAIDRDAWPRRSFWRRLLENTVRLWSPLL
jgi:cardiolipin synthase